LFALLFYELKALIKAFNFSKEGVKKLMDTIHRDYLKACLPLIVEQIQTGDSRFYPLYDSRAMNAIILLKTLKASGEVSESDLRRICGFTQERLNDYLALLFTLSIATRRENKAIALLNDF
jgi:hypothetical protein